MRNSWTAFALTLILLYPPYAQERTFDLELEGVPLGMALQTLARHAQVNLVLAGGEDLKVNAVLKNVRVEQALEILLKPLGLEYRLVQGCYVVGTKDQLSRWDTPPPQTPSAPQPPVVEIYTVRFVNTASLLTTLQQVHPDVKVLPGVPAYSPQLTTQQGREGEGVSASGGTTQGQGTPSESIEQSRTLLLYGPADRVAQALETAKRLDQPPTQIRIEVMVSDIGRNALKELGLDYSWSKLSIQEIVRTGEKDQIANETTLKPFDTSTFWRAPLGFEATLRALEQRGVAKLLARPSISVLNGESAQILIGERVLYPVVSGTTTAGTPLFDVREQQVGIVLVVRAYAEPEGTITLDIYPQVSVITGFLRVGESSFPQIATRELRTKIRVKDGTTIALGGLIREEEMRNLSQVPLLGNLPILGELFKSRRKSTVQNELVIFLKPEILRE